MADEASANAPWPDGMEMIRQLREAAGMFAGAMPITPQQAWEEALDRVRRQRRLLAAVAERVPYETDPDLLDLVSRTVMEVPAVCVCGHPQEEHHGEPGRGPCMFSTPAETWACGCNEYATAGGRRFSLHDSNEPAWWLQGHAVPEDWTVEGTVTLRGPDGGWVRIDFGAGSPVTELTHAVNETDERGASGS